MVRIFKFIPLLLFLGLIMPQVVASPPNMLVFSQNPVFWEDFSSFSSVASFATNLYNERNSTELLLSNDMYADKLPFYSFINKSLDISLSSADVSIGAFGRLNAPIFGDYMFWNQNYAYRKKISVIGSSSGNISGYVMKFFIMYGSGVDVFPFIYLAGKCQTDFDDIRFWSNNTQYDYWIENIVLGSYATVWVEISETIPVYPDRLIFYIYYGDVSASSYSNGYNTFLVYRTWDNGTPSSVGEGTFTVRAPSWLDGNTFGTGTAYHGARTAEYSNSFNILNGLRIRTWWDFKSNSAGNKMGRLTINGSTSVGANQFMFVVTDGSGVNVVHQVMYYDCLTGTYELGFDSGITPINNTFELRLYENSGVDWWVFKNNTLSLYGDKDYDYSIAKWAVGIEQYSTYTISEITHNDWFFMAKYIYPEPVAIIDFERHKPYMPAPPPPSGEYVSEPDNMNNSMAIKYGLRYFSGSEVRSISFIYNETAISIFYYSGAGVLKYYTYLFSFLHTQYDDYLELDFRISRNLRTVTFDVYNSSRNKIISYTDFTELLPDRLTDTFFNLTANVNNFEWINSSYEIVWIAAPFTKLSYIKNWELSGTVNPYSINATSLGVIAYSSVKVIPCQGFKFLWNVTERPQGSMFPLETSITFESYSFGGIKNPSRSLGIILYVNQYSVDLRLVSWSIYPSYTIIWERSNWAFTYSSPITYAAYIGIALWHDVSGRVFICLQSNPESSTIGDYWIFDVTQYFDLNSWGIKFINRAAGEASNHWICSTLREVEIFAGQRDGISQPRFGGNIWQFNPFFALFLGLQALIGLILSPIGGILNGWNNIFTTWGNIFSDWITHLDDLGVSIGELITGIQNAMFNNWYLQLTGFAQGFLDVLGYFSLLAFGNQFLLPAAWINFGIFVYTMIASIASGLGIGAVLINLIIQSLIYGTPTAVSPAIYASYGWLITIVYLVVTYVPPLFAIWILITVMRCVEEQEIQPLIDMGLVFLDIGMKVFSIVETVVGWISKIIITIGEIIPF